MPTYSMHSILGTTRMKLNLHHKILENGLENGKLNRGQASMHILQSFYKKRKNVTLLNLVTAKLKTHEIGERP